jgi:hypothetical protein
LAQLNHRGHQTVCYFLLLVLLLLLLLPRLILPLLPLLFLFFIDREIGRSGVKENGESTPRQRSQTNLVVSQRFAVGLRFAFVLPIIQHMVLKRKTEEGTEKPM